MSDSGMVKLLTTTDLLDVPEPEWLIEDHIHQQEVGVIYGVPNGGKTFVALDWALSVAAGVKWLGKYKTLQGPVLYMAGEGAPSLQKRVEGWMIAKDVAELPAYFQCRPLPILEEEIVEEVREALAAFKVDKDMEPGVSPALIVVDTLSQFMMGGDENGTDMAIFVARLRHLSQEENCAVLIVHHTNKGGMSERGHTALRGNVDVMFRCEHEEKEGQLFSIKLTNDKQRDSARAEAETLEVAKSHRSLILSLAKRELVPTSIMRLTSERLKKLLIQAETIEDTDTEIFTIEDWLPVSELPRASFFRERDKLLELRLIKGSGRGAFKFTPKGRATVTYYRSPKSQRDEKG